jgi:hypothetical protein
MKRLNSDEKYKYLKRKIENNEPLTEEDILNLTFLPLMSGSDSKTERAIKGIELAENIKYKEIKAISLSMLYALFEKFGDTISKNRLEEAIRMTEIGKMIRDEAKAEMLLKQLMKKFKKLPEEYKNKIKGLSEDALEIIATGIFEIEKVEDLQKYF